MMIGEDNYNYCARSEYEERTTVEQRLKDAVIILVHHGMMKASPEGLDALREYRQLLSSDLDQYEYWSELGPLEQVHSAMLGIELVDSILGQIEARPQSLKRAKVKLAENIAESAAKAAKEAAECE